MWRRKLIVLPRWFVYPIYKVNLFLNKLIPVKESTKIGPENSDRDIYNLLEKSNSHISFTKNEEKKRKK